jgi:hypothetical protein
MSERKNDSKRELSDNQVYHEKQRQLEARRNGQRKERKNQQNKPKE